MGFDGGVSAQQMTSDTFRVVARGNGYTATNAIEDYVMLKAAETTTQRRASHFIVVSGDDASHADQIVTGGVAHTSFYGNSATTIYTPPVVSNIFKPGQDVYIRVVRLAPGQHPPPGAVDAAEIIQFVGPRVKRPKT